MTKVQGLDKLSAQMKRIPAAIKAAMQAEMAKRAEALASSIRSHVPILKGRHSKRKPGQLRNSVGWAHGLPPASSATGAFRIKSGNLTSRQTTLNDNGLLYTVYEGSSEAYWARWVEHGTKAGVAGDRRQIVRRRTARGWREAKVGERHKRTHPGTKAQPHFYPVVRLYTKRIRSGIARAANRALKEVAGR